MEIFNHRRMLGASAAILFLAVSLCISQSSAQFDPLEGDCPPSLFNLAARSKAFCLDESRGLTTTTEAPTTPAEEDDVDALFEEENEAEPEETSPTPETTTPTPEASTRPSRRQRNKSRRQNRRRRMQLFKECFHREMSNHPVAADMMDACADQVAHRSAVVEEIREKRCFIDMLNRECPGVLSFGRGRRHNRLNFRRFRGGVR